MKAATQDGVFTILHRWLFCGPRRKPTRREAEELIIWICPTCRGGFYAESNGEQRYWIPME